MPVGVRLNELAKATEDGDGTERPTGVGIHAYRQVDDRDRDHDSVIERPEPIFIPPLQLQRQQFILSTLQGAQEDFIRPLIEDLERLDGSGGDAEVEALVARIRKASIKTVLDIGCGSGELLGVLASPKHAANAHEDGVLDLDRIVGVDVDREILDNAIDELGLSREGDLFQSTRFTPLQFEIYCSSLSLPVFEQGRSANIDAIVLTEVVEHLHDPVLETFPTSVLVRYRPRLCIVTTPNYTFNRVFRLLSANDTDTEVVLDNDARLEAEPLPRHQFGRGHRFPDPTGRTDRIFRHSDHKFEWTSAEFREWAGSVQVKVAEAAPGLVYDCRYDGVGRVPWGQLRRIGVDEAIIEELQGVTATQCCIFTRRDPEGCEVAQTKSVAPIQDTLVLSKTFEPTYAQRQDPQVIFDLVRDQMQLSLPLLDPTLVDENVMWTIRNGVLEKELVEVLSECRKGIDSLFVTKGIKDAVLGDRRFFSHFLSASENRQALLDKGLDYLTPADEYPVVRYRSALDRAFDLSKIHPEQNEGHESDQGSWQSGENSIDSMLDQWLETSAQPHQAGSDGFDWTEADTNDVEGWD